MSWIKIEFQREKTKDNTHHWSEQIDYDKIREITREVVKEELASQQSNQPTLLTKEDIQEAVCNGIIQADTRREEITKDRIKNTKLSGGTIAAMVFFSIAAAFFFSLAVVSVVTNLGNLVVGIINASKFLIISFTYVLVVFVEYALGKNKEKSFAYNTITILMTFITFVVAIIQQ